MTIHSFTVRTWTQGTSLGCARGEVKVVFAVDGDSERTLAFVDVVPRTGETVVLDHRIHEVLRVRHAPEVGDAVVVDLRPVSSSA